MDEQERQGFIKKIGISADDSDDSDEDEDEDEPEHHKYNCKKCQVRLRTAQTPGLQRPGWKRSGIPLSLLFQYEYSSYFLM